ncbi:39S ribosomal protein L40 mitochondrial [Echinococcus multilocularis]|uniref:Large ribosomal subunit protein mL40 n=1 Tax=Echinococcus multilocularis TaxID=6211 RepID=A0A068YIG2_ECHMU|nr:39S ribosomal protein L40 mitochondrial [Echinococcus multilocularis]
MCWVASQFIEIMASLVGRFFTPSKSAELILVESLRCLHVGNVLCAEPLKKKKRVDPQQEQNRIRRKAKRIEREIKRLSRQGKKLKPVEEIEGDRQLMKEEQDRRRLPTILSEDEIDSQVLLMKEWARYQARVARVEERKLRSVQTAQQRALRSLAAISPYHLYAAAIQPVGVSTSAGGVTDVTEVAPLCLSTSGPFATAPPRGPKSYEAPDGEKIDRTPTFEYEFELDRKFMAEAKRNKFVKIFGKNQAPL